MKAELAGGKYVIAVSGGVDSMVLLDLLAQKSGIELVVAHFNHGIRDVSDEDEELVRRTSETHDLKFEAGHEQLGPKVSEAAARKARYGFLRTIKDRHEAVAIVTAHHLDDYLETALINLIRGTGRRGLVAISSNQQVLRPLLKYPKSEILAYAVTHDLVWREDETNESDDYLRNYLRNGFLKRLSAHEKRQMVKNIDKIAKTDPLINQQLAMISRSIIKDDVIDRNGFSLLPAQIGDELVVHWFRQKRLSDYDRKTISRISNAIRTNRARTSCVIRDNLWLTFTDKTARFERTV